MNNKWTFRRILDHALDLKPSDPHRKRGCSSSFQVKWESGEVTWEPAHTFAQDCSIVVAQYCKENDLFDKGIKIFNHLKYMAKNEKKMLHMLNKAKLKSF